MVCKPLMGPEGEAFREKVFLHLFLTQCRHKTNNPMISDEAFLHDIRTRLIQYDNRRAHKIQAAGKPTPSVVPAATVTTPIPGPLGTPTAPVRNPPAAVAPVTPARNPPPKTTPVSTAAPIVSAAPITSLRSSMAPKASVKASAAPQTAAVSYKPRPPVVPNTHPLP